MKSNSSNQASGPGQNISINTEVLATCEIEVKEFQAAFTCVLRTFPTEVIKRTISKPDIADLQSAQIIYRTGCIVKKLSKTVGFSRVVKQIKQQQGSLTLPRAEWHQLETAYLLQDTYADLQLEQELQGAPRDILLDSQTLNIECRALLEGKKIRSEYEKHFQQLQPGATAILHGFSVDQNRIRSPMSIGLKKGTQSTVISAPVDERARLRSIFLEKADQAPIGIPTILTIDEFFISKNSSMFVTEILDLFDVEVLPQISAILVLEKEWNARTQGWKLLTKLIQNKNAEHAVTASFIERLPPRTGFKFNASAD